MVSARNIGALSTFAPRRRAPTRRAALAPSTICAPRDTERPGRLTCHHQTHRLDNREDLAENPRTSAQPMHEAGHAAAPSSMRLRPGQQGCQHLGLEARRIQRDLGRVGAPAICHVGEQACAREGTVSKAGNSTTCDAHAAGSARGARSRKAGAGRLRFARKRSSCSTAIALRKSRPAVNRSPRESPMAAGPRGNESAAARRGSRGRATRETLPALVQQAAALPPQRAPARRPPPLTSLSFSLSKSS